MIDRHSLLDDRIAVTARANGIDFSALSLTVLRGAYVEEITTTYADYASDEDRAGAFVNVQAIATELRRRDKDKAQQFLDDIHAMMLDVCPQLDLSHITCH
ncbi:MAG: hypothetical protein V3V97_06440 [Hyphomicrobiaceae bacterium]